MYTGSIVIVIKWMVVIPGARSHSCPARKWMSYVWNESVLCGLMGTRLCLWFWFIFHKMRRTMCSKVYSWISKSTLKMNPVRALNLLKCKFWVKYTSDTLYPTTMQSLPSQNRTKISLNFPADSYYWHTNTLPGVSTPIPSHKLYEVNENHA